MLRAGKADGLHIGEEHPVQEEAVVPVNEKPHPVTDSECLPETLDSGQPQQAEQQGKGKQKGKSLLNKHRRRKELCGYTLVRLEVFLLNVLGLVLDPPDWILDEGDENHGRKGDGHGEGFNDNNSPIHSSCEVTFIYRKPR